jgi:protein SCO1
MADLSRRSLLRWTAMAPLGAASLAAANDKSKATTQSSTPTVSDLARQRIQRLHLPNVPLVTQDGQRVLFYDDLVKDKIVSLNFFYAKCDEVCPLVMANLAKVQKLLAADLNKDLFMYSITLKPEEDTVDVLKHHHEMYGALPGWTYLTGKPEDVEKVRNGIGFTYPDPKIDADKTQHIGNVRYGNEPMMLWSACPGMAHAGYLAESISWMVHLDRPGPGIKQR